MLSPGNKKVASVLGGFCFGKTSETSELIQFSLTLLFKSDCVLSTSVSAVADVVHVWSKEKGKMPGVLR